MGLAALVSQHEDQANGEDAPFEHHVTPVPTQALARLDRFATASVLATGLAHEIANPLACLMAALQGGYLLSQAAHNASPMAASLNMALEHIETYAKKAA